MKIIKKIFKRKRKYNYQVVNDKRIDAIKDNFLPPSCDEEELENDR